VSLVVPRHYLYPHVTVHTIKNKIHPPALLSAYPRVTDDPAGQYYSRADFVNMKEEKKGSSNFFFNENGVLLFLIHI
jgi:hypothetical protein